jgi:hypothetical protein
MRIVLTVSLLLIILFSCSSLQAQITITETDIQNAVLNARRTNYDNGDTLTVNLGTASNSTQTWNFQNLSWGNVTHRDTSYEDIVTPAGRLRAEEFPTATAASVGSQSQTNGGFTFTFTFAFYYELNVNSLKLLGGALRQQISPPPPPPYVADTTIVVHSVQQYLPLPLVLGLSETWTDTAKSFDGSYEVQTHTINVNGFGTLTFPDGRTLSVLRIVDDRVDLDYDHNGQYVQRSRRRHITFYAQDFTVLEFDVDTNYTGGSTLADGWSFQLRTGTLGVEQTSPEVPETFVLSQNFPNPFNPTTQITFSLPEAEYASLKVFNLIGEEVATLVEQQLPAGSYKFNFDASKLPSGLYIYRLSAGTHSQSKKLMLLK